MRFASSKAGISVLRPSQHRDGVRCTQGTPSLPSIPPIIIAMRIWKRGMMPLLAGLVRSSFECALKAYAYIQPAPGHGVHGDRSTMQSPNVVVDLHLSTLTPVVLVHPLGSTRQRKRGSSSILSVARYIQATNLPCMLVSCWMPYLTTFLSYVSVLV